MFYNYSRMLWAMLQKQRVAQVISRLLSPFVVIPIAVGYLLFFHTGTDGDFDVSFLILSGITAFAIPGGVLIYATLGSKISDVEIKNRTERVPILFGLLPGMWLTVILSYWYKQPELFLFIVSAGALTFTILTFITLSDKASLHAGGITVLYMTINIIFGWMYWYGALTILLVWWARRTLNVHSYRQLAIGTGIPILIFLTLQPLMLQ